MDAAVESVSASDKPTGNASTPNRVASPGKTNSVSTRAEEADAASSIDTSGDQATEVPLQASFLGLPAEMRLRIYDHLLDAGRRPASEIANPLLPARWHCCFNDTRGGRMKCTCTSTVYPAILRVCKLVNQEALPVLRASLEIRIDTPAIFGRAIDFDHVELLNLIRSGEGLGVHIERLFLATSMRKLPIRVQRGESRSNQLKPLWAELAARVFNIKSFRFYLCFNMNLKVVDETFDYDEILGLLVLSKLRKLIFEVFVVEEFVGTTDRAGSNLNDFLHKLKQKADDRIKELGREVEVTTILREEVTMNGSKGE
ncbi:uncharacterized protein RCC_10046 [Ramularia collo-cygni]|uniref:F-box domain-containing protein n=1 Tax=Ramularia collo-cygni TaxID=112498 RepID=A0A2D3V8J4_9PEZI|nr:uncharacterized protein RCC_10046 [Ramularia collo-cygni]CZT24323.1 uncharacterized protein RCC_10046 [Ramularia collo-cygni]